MEYNELQSKPIKKLLNNCTGQMPDLWLHDIHNYIVFGFKPGSFHESLYANDLSSAANHSSFNKWSWIQSFILFLQLHAPPQCWGGRNKVKEWLALSGEERYEICHLHGLIFSPEELTWDIVENGK